MKPKIFSGSLLVILLSALLSGKASALIITEIYGDHWIAFPGWEDPTYPNDEMGDPKIASIAVNLDEDTRILDSVVISMTGRLTWDNLFINSSREEDEGYDAWDYLAWDKGSKTIFYEVAENYDYEYVTESGRIGHPNTIDSNNLTERYTEWDPASGFVSYDGEKLTYDFAHLYKNFSLASIILGENYMIAYTPWCANDVIGTAPIPEPATMLLFGTGLAGLLGVARSRMRKE